MKVCIVGGGHIGTTLACHIKHYDKSIEVNLLTGKPQKFLQPITCNDIEHGESYTATIDRISDSQREAIPDADLILIAQPHFLIRETFEKIAPYTTTNAYIGVIPGSGGCEFFFDTIFRGNAHLFGFQRVPFTAKLVSYGQETNLKSWKPYSKIAALRSADTETACSLIEQCGLRTRKAANFLAVALVPSNPVLHTARTYDLFHNYTPDHVFEEHLKYYLGWSDETSRILLGMDGELHQLFAAMPSLDMSSVLPLLKHYGVNSQHELTQKINRIPTFQTVYAPLIPDTEHDGRWRVDLRSRMFTEDFPWGLCIIRAYCDLFDVACPTIDQVLSWYEQYMHLQYYQNGKFEGADLQSTGIPQNYGITSRQQIIDLYTK